MLTAAVLLFLFVTVHALCDYPLQGDFLARAKNHTAPIPGVPWYQALLAHAAIHALGVYVVVGLVFDGAAALGLQVALAEFVMHCFIDHTKCDGVISYNADQAAHLLCKVTWVAAILPRVPL